MKLSPLELEHYLAGTLEPERTRQIEALLAEDAALLAHVEQRRALDDQLSRDPRVKNFAALAELGEKKRPRAFAWLGASGLAAAALAMSFFLDFGDDVLVRGGVKVRALLSREGRTESMVSGARLEPGDRIRIQIEDPTGGHPVIVWADDRGQARTVHSPEDLGYMKPPVLTLPDSFEIDREPGRERIIVILCEEPPDIDRWPAEIAEKYDGRWIPPDGCRMGMFEWRVE